jgi:hypothetical protein
LESGALNGQRSEVSMHDVVFNRLARPGTGVANERVGQAVVALPFILLGAWLCRAWFRPLTFDDAYMFYRYALNIRDGLGLAWNPDGIPTYGTTSQLWTFFVLPLTLLPVSLGHTLVLASWLTGIAALATLAEALTRRAQSPLLQGRSLAFVAIAAPLLLNPVFAYHLTTGMDTMLSLWANAAVVFAVLEYVGSPTTRKSCIVGGLSVLAVLARPDSGLCALGVPALAWLTLWGQRRWGDLFGLCVVPAVLIAGELLLCQWYFHVPLPLGFYAKSVHSYVGFTSHENAVQYAYMAAATALPFVALLAATLEREKLALILSLLLPAFATLLYLLTVRQVMGFVGRYYIPLLPFIVLPALLSADAALTRGRLPLRRIGVALAITVALYAAVRPFELGLERDYTARVVPQPVAVPALPLSPRVALPRYNKWYPTVPVLGRLIAALPPGAIVAASEVGYIAAAAPHATIIDLVGLNDTSIGLHGFSMDSLLARAPDLIWFPHTDYTGLRATILSDPRLYEQYVVIADAFDFGVAIRRTSALRGDIERELRTAWRKLYPSASLADYVVPDSYTPDRMQ